MTAITAATQVLVHFIGLVAMVPGAGHVVHAVLPPISSPVPAHTAAILYPTGTATYSAGWTNGPQTFQATNNWSYVELEAGDRVSFLMSPSPNRPAVPAELTHLKDCSRFPDLQNGFKPPAFASARAVVDIPYGTLTAVKQFAPNPATARIDTQLAFDDNGPVVVLVTTTTAATRILVLQPGTCLAVAHEPTPLFTGQGQIPSNVLHTAAFQAMAAIPNHTQNCSEWNDAAKATAVKAPPQSSPGARLSTLPPPQISSSACPMFPMTIHQAHTMNSDCSNSQWP